MQNPRGDYFHSSHPEDFLSANPSSRVTIVTLSHIRTVSYPYSAIVIQRHTRAQMIQRRKDLVLTHLTSLLLQTRNTLVHRRVSREHVLQGAEGVRNHHGARRLRVAVVRVHRIH